MPSIDQFIESFLTAVDFQEAVAVLSLIHI